jgi:DNA polymerase
MHHLSIDLETRSGADITKTGSYRYLQDPDFKILLFGYRVDDGPVQVIDLEAGEEIPGKIVTALHNPQYIKHAYNAAFEWYALNRAGYKTPIEQWQDTMIWALYCGYAAGLANTGEAIGLAEDKKKLMTGKALIRYFCTPQRQTKTFKKKYHDPADDPEKWELFKEYNAQDVVAESAILARLSRFPVPESEWELWRDDIRMNAFGVHVDTQLIAGALNINDQSQRELTEEAARITGLANPNSTAQLLPWLADHGCPLDNLQKLTVEETLQRDDLDPDVRRVLQLRQLLGKTSIKKYVAMETAMGEGERVRGISQFYGANRTGRYAGRLVQMQNLPRNYLSTLDSARKMARASNYEGLKMIYGNVPDTLSQLIRTAFIPSEGRHFVVADFSAIEARMIAWLAGEQWVMDVFANDQDIYCETASAMFGVPVEKHGVNSDLRQKGKIATLALGYQGSINAMIAMGALRMGIPEDDLPDIVEKWRTSHPKTVGMWYRIEEAAVSCVSSGEPARPDCGAAPISGIEFRMENDLLYGQTFMTIQLPTGRKLYYPKPFLKENKFGKMAIHYYGVDQTSGKWGEQSTYGGKLTENIVQAIARDCLCEVIRRIYAKGWDLVFHVHDEVIVDAPLDVHTEDLCALMDAPIDWAPGLLLKGAGFEADYYMKD